MALKGDDIRQAIGMGDDVMGQVQDDLKRIARESRIKVLTGDQRRDFFRNMTQDEFDLMHAAAMGMGQNGLTALERLMQEATTMFAEDEK